MNYVHAPPPPVSCHSLCMLIPASQRGCIHQGEALCIHGEPVIMAKQLMNRYSLPVSLCEDSIAWRRLLTPQSARVQEYTSRMKFSCVDLGLSKLLSQLL